MLSRSAVPAPSCRPFTFVLIAVLAAALSGCSDRGEKPLEPPAGGVFVSRLIPERTIVGDTVIVVGSGFGSARGASQVFFSGMNGDLEAEVIPGTWSDGEIHVVVPAGATSGPVRVQAGGLEGGSRVFRPAPAEVRFERDVAPLLQSRCAVCHSGPSASNSLEVDYDGLLDGGISGPAVVSRRSGESLLLRKLLPGAPGQRMPQGGPFLSEAQIELMADWIDQGLRRGEAPPPPQPPVVVVTAPNGGEALVAGSSFDVTYQATDPDTPTEELVIDLEYSVDNGATWRSIAAGLPNTGTHAWTVPAEATTSALARATVREGGRSGQDVSDAVFAISLPPQPPQVSLLQPDGGEEWQAGTEREILYQTEDPDTPNEVLRLDLEVSTDAGATWSLIAFDQSVSGSYRWAVPDAPTTEAMVRVTVTDGQLEATDQSAAPFTITEAPPPPQPPVVTVIHPDGGETLVAGAQELVRWTAVDPDTPSESLLLQIDFSTDGGGTWQEVGSQLENSGQFLWQVPEAPTSQALVRIAATDGILEAVDTSNATFTIALPVPPPVLEELMPARTTFGDEVVIAGTGFGSEAGDAVVLFTAAGGDAEAVVADGGWTDTAVTVLVPDGAIDGTVRIERGGASSNELSFSVAPRWISFANDVLPVFNRPSYGCTGCHGGTNNLYLETHEDVMRGDSDHGPVVIPRWSSRSVLIGKLLAPPPFGDRMPPGSSMNEEDILLIRDWIDQGARDN